MAKTIDQGLEEMMMPKPEGGQQSNQEAPTITPDDVQEPNEQVMEIEAKLGELGYDPGEPDGLFDEKTEEAVKKFKSDMKMDDADSSDITPGFTEAVMSAAPEGLNLGEGEGEQPAQQPNMSLGGGL